METRIRRGKEVSIPKEWQNKVPSNQTMLKRKAEARKVRLGRKKRLRQSWADHLLAGKD